MGVCGGVNIHCCRTCHQLIDILSEMCLSVHVCLLIPQIIEDRIFSSPDKMYSHNLHVGLLSTTSEQLKIIPLQLSITD